MNGTVGSEHQQVVSRFGRAWRQLMGPIHEQCNYIPIHGNGHLAQDILPGATKTLGPGLRPSARQHHNKNILASLTGEQDASRCDGIMEMAGNKELTRGKPHCIHRLVVTGATKSLRPLDEAGVTQLQEKCVLLA